MHRRGAERWPLGIGIALGLALALALALDFASSLVVGLEITLDLADTACCILENGFESSRRYRYSTE